MAAFLGNKTASCWRTGQLGNLDLVLERIDDVYAVSCSRTTISLRCLRPRERFEIWEGHSRVRVTMALHKKSGYDTRGSSLV